MKEGEKWEPPCFEGCQVCYYEMYEYLLWEGLCPWCWWELNGCEY
jgi:hypothetical protein